MVTQDVVEAAPAHLPVMPRECVRELAIQAGDVVVDCTAGAGGHLRLFAEATGPGGRVVGLDRDRRAFADDAAGGIAKAFSNVSLVHRPFSEIEAALHDQHLARVDVVFADLGVSSMQLDEGARGFSFRTDAPLDMRMDTSQGETAAALIERLSDTELADVIFQHGGETRSRKIARYIKDRRPTTTEGLASAVMSAVGGRRGSGGKIHPATKTFQALRIAVNEELQQLDRLLEALPRVLREGGRAGFLTFHSLEDRAVKVLFKTRRKYAASGPHRPGYGPSDDDAPAAAGTFQQTTKKPLTASDDEVRDNPRSRSAKLRVAVFATSAVEAAVEADRAVDDEDDSEDDDDTDEAGDDA